MSELTPLFIYRIQIRKKWTWDHQTDYYFSSWMALACLLLPILSSLHLSIREEKKALDWLNDRVISSHLLSHWFSYISVQARLSIHTYDYRKPLGASERKEGSLPYCLTGHGKVRAEEGGVSILYALCIHACMGGEVKWSKVSIFNVTLLSLHRVTTLHTSLVYWLFLDRSIYIYITIVPCI